MPKIQDMTDAQIAGLFYLALWNDEIAKVLADYPNATPVLEETGTTGFHLWSQQFGYANMAASSEIIRESCAFLRDQKTKWLAVDQKIASITRKLPLLKRSENPAFNDVLVVWFKQLAQASRNATPDVIKGYLEHFHNRINAYAKKCINKHHDPKLAVQCLMPALVSVMLRHLMAERLNFIKATMLVSFFEAPYKEALLKQQSPDHQQEVLAFINNNVDDNQNCKALLQIFRVDFPESRQKASLKQSG